MKFTAVLLNTRLQILGLIILLPFCYYYADHGLEAARQAIQIIPPSLLHTNKQHTTLVPMAFEPLPLGSIRPTGWIKEQLVLMSEGLAGHMFDFYDYVNDATWIGGDTEYSGLNEGFPYWFNGMVPLAYGLDDERLKRQIHTTADVVLAMQTDEGWLGPETGLDRLLWARFPLCLGFMQLAEADSAWTERIVESLHRFTRLMHAMLSDDGAGYSRGDGYWSFAMLAWGRVRSHDMIIVLQWLYEQHPGDQGKILLENMQMLHDLGHSWHDWYASYFDRKAHHDFWTMPTDESTYHFQHGVNVAQGLKSAAVIRRFTHDEKLLQSAFNAVNLTFTYHGSASGTIIADERLAGLAPFSGSELCASVETVHSLSYLYHATGDRYYADLAERAMYNSFPTMMATDFWSHQYVSSANQPNAIPLDLPLPFYNTNNMSQTFGLEPHYPCCTVNHIQGLPKYTSSSFVRVGSNGIAHALLGPGTVDFTLPTGKVLIEASTMYPYAGTIEYHVVADASFDLHLRVPAWADESACTITTSEYQVSASPDKHSGLHRLTVPAGTSRITYDIPTVLHTKSRPNDTISVYVGALLYAINIETTSTSSKPRRWNHAEELHNAPVQSKDWISEANSAWNYAIDPATLTYHEPQYGDLSPSLVGKSIWKTDGNFGIVSVQGCEIDWPEIYRGVPDYPPINKTCHKSVTLQLIPLASAKLHIADIPVIHLP